MSERSFLLTRLDLEVGALLVDVFLVVDLGLFIIIEQGAI